MNRATTRKIATAFAKYGFDNCQRCWELNVLHGEGPTVQAYETGLHRNSTSAAVDAYHAWMFLNNLPRTRSDYTRPTFSAETHPSECPHCGRNLEHAGPGATVCADSDCARHDS